MTGCAGAPDDTPRLGPFAVLERIGTGGMSQVWRGVHSATGVPVAIKFAELGLDLDIDGPTAFRREVEAVARLDHPNVIAVLDHGMVPVELAERLGLSRGAPAPYMVMEYASRGTLLDVRLPIDWVDLLNLCAGILHGLGHAHAHGIIHRDIKPGNVLLGSSADLRPCVKLADFGIAHALSHHRRTTGEFTASSVEAALGTPRYMAPEQFRGRWRDYGPWTDLYAFGVLVWELATGDVPFTSLSPYELARLHLTEPLPEFRPRFAVPDGLRAWLERLLQKAPAERLRTVAGALAELELLTEEWCARLDPRAAALARGRRTQAPDGPSQRNARAILSGAGVSLFSLRVPPLTGRDEIAGVMEEELSTVVAESTMRVVVVSGRAGSGVSHLVDTSTRRFDERGAAHALPRVDATGGEFDYLSKLLVALYRCSGLGEDDTRARLVQELVHEGVDSADAELLASAAAYDGSLTMPLTSAVRHAFAQLLLRLARRGPIVAAVTADALRRGACALARSALDLEAAGRGVPLLVLVDRQSGGGVPEEWPCRMDRCLSLTPISDAAILETTRSMLPLEPGLEQFVVSAANGMPGVLMNMLRAWTAGALLFHTSAGFAFDAAASPGPVAPNPRWRPSTAPVALDPSRVVQPRPLRAHRARSRSVPKRPAPLPTRAEHEACLDAIARGASSSLALSARLLDRLEECGASVDDPRWACAVALRASALAGAGALGPAWRLSVVLSEWAMRTGTAVVQGDALMLRAWALLRSGGAEEAASLARRAASVYELHHWGAGRALALSVLARASGSTAPSPDDLVGLGWVAAVQLAEAAYTRAGAEESAAADDVREADTTVPLVGIKPARRLDPIQTHPLHSEAR